ncbi:MAG: tyrosine--tRNA ligase [Candidatus Gastranaerophilales bacterium]|nr:tyrosine--tRNA ligase [Candidatus Gastranaerophilales bacterium]
MEQTTEKLEEKYIEQAKKLGRDCEILPGGVEELARKLQNSAKKGIPLKIKLGMDPSRPDLHLGHTVVMRKIREFQKLGHTLQLLVGGATAMIGDPSGKSDTRPALTKEQVDENAKTYFEQISKVITVNSENVYNNADWLHKLNLPDMLSLCSKVTVAQIMTRDDFNARYKAGTPIAIHEFFYPLLQAYDSVVLDCDIELGGTDQRFNTLLGRDMQLAYGKKEPQIVMLLPLLEGTDGVKKMSKSFPEHCIGICDKPSDMYGKLMSIPDELIVRYFSLLTDLSNEEIEEIKKSLTTTNPRDLKMRLGHLITEMYCGKDEADKAEAEFVNVVQNKGVPSDIPEIHLTENKALSEIVLENKLVESKGELKRLIAQGGVKINDEKCSDINYTFDTEKLPLVLKVGKRKFLKISK